MYLLDWEGVVKLSDDFNGADLRNVCTEAGNICYYSILFVCEHAHSLHSVVQIVLFLKLGIIVGMFAIRADRDYVIEEDLMKAVRKVGENKKLESKLDYKPI